MGDKTVSVRVRFEGGDQVKAGLTEVGRESARAMQNLGGVSARTGQQLQNAGYQVSDFFVQIAGGTAPTRALAQQMPQLLQGLGLVGVAASVVIAALPSLWSLINNGAQETENLSKSIAKLGDDLQGYQEYARIAAMSTAELAEEFGNFSGQIRGFSEYLKGVALAQTFDDLKGTVATLNGPLAAVQQQFANLAMMKQKMADIPLDDAEGILRAKEAMGVFEDQLASAAAELGIMPDQARELAIAIDAIGSSTTPSEIASSAAAALDVMKQIAPAGQSLPAPLREAATALNVMASEAAKAATNVDTGKAAVDAMLSAAGSLSSAFDVANSAAGGLVGTLADAAINAWNLAGAMGAADKARAAAVGGGRGLGPQGPTLDAYGFRDQLKGQNLIKPLSGGRSGGSGGGSGGVDSDIARAKSLTEGVRTETEKYAMALAEVDRLKTKGLITDETYNRQLDKLQDKLGEMGDLGQKAAGAIKGAFDGLFDDPEEALKNLSKQLAQMALYAGLAKAFPSVFGAGGMVPLGVKGYASGGFHGGGLRIVGENGPELEATGPSMIYPNSALRGMSRGGGGGGTSVQVINNSGQTARTETSRGPDGREMVRVIVGEEIARGRMDKPMRGRFGTGTQKVVR